MMIKRFILLIAIFLFGLMGSFAWIQVGETATQSTVCRVRQDATGDKDGTSWFHAYSSLQAALHDNTCTELWVAKGTYRTYTTTNPVSATSHRDVAFELRSGLAVYGGFAGGETNLSERDWEANITILTGDMEGNDILGLNGYPISPTDIVGDNAYNVVVAENVDHTAVLDGFYITGGWADDVRSGCNLGDCGGGVHINNSSLTLNQLAIVSNLANRGGGLSIEGTGQPTITNSFIRGNWAESGAGIYIEDGTPILENLDITRNRSFNVGGGVWIRGADPHIKQTVIKENFAASDGGGIYSERGGYTLTSVLISHNNASRSGGGVYNYSSNNNNTDSLWTNVTLVSNRALSTAGGLYLESSNVEMHNSVIWNNMDTSGLGTAGATIYEDGTSSSSIEYSLLQALFPAGSGNLDGTTSTGYLLFKDQFRAGQTPSTPDYRPQLTSILVDAGNNSAPNLADAPLDLQGSDRVQNGQVDLGAYESAPLLCPESGHLHVKDQWFSTGQGESWDSPVGTLLDALTVQGDCEIWVAKGSYELMPIPYSAFPNFGLTDIFPNPAHTFQLRDGLSVYGGFTGTETARNQRDWRANLTILSGDLEVNDTTDSRSLVTDTSQISGTNTYHVVTGSGVTRTAVLDGFYINAGHANGTADSTCSEQCGGGIYNDNGSPTLRNLVILGNQTTDDGGGIYNLNGSQPLLEDVTIISNTAQSSGGGIYNALNSPARLDRVFLQGNSAQFLAGGIYNRESDSELVNVVMSGNYAGSSGGGMFNNDASPNLTNVTISSNRTNGSSGGGIANTFSSHTDLSNVLIWNNQAGGTVGTADVSLYNVNGSTSTITHSLIQGQFPAGDGNLDGTVNTSDPHFITPVDPATAPNTAGDFRLLLGGSGIDAGDQNVSGLTNVVQDIATNARLFGQVDLGAYERHDCPSSGILYVDSAAPIGSNDGVSWGTALINLQDALQVSDPCQIWVAKGIHYPDVTAGQDSDMPHRTFQIPQNVAVYGGFAGTETDLGQREAGTSTILSGDIDQNDINSSGGLITSALNISGTNSYSVVTFENVTRTAVLDHFIITAGSATGADDATCSERCGAGIKNTNSSPSLVNLVVNANYAQHHGAGLYNDALSDPILTNVEIRGNYAGVNGGGIYNINGSNPELMNVVLSGNRALVYGGGIYNSNSSPVLINSTISGNFAEFGGGGGMYNADNSSPSLSNVVIWHNQTGMDVGTADASSIDFSGSLPSINTSLIQGQQPPGIDNINGLLASNNPLFIGSVDLATVPTTAGNFRLGAGSPAADWGNNSVVQLDVYDLDGDGDQSERIPFDVSGQERIRNNIVDLGAYEGSPFDWLATFDNPNDEIDFSWTYYGAGTCTAYELYRYTAPYFEPPTGTVIFSMDAAAHSQSGDTGNPAVSYFYRLQLTGSNCANGYSDKYFGAFTFALQPGN